MKLHKISAIVSIFGGRNRATTKRNNPVVLILLSVVGRATSILILTPFPDERGERERARGVRWNDDALL